MFYVSWKRFALAVLLRRPPGKIDFHWRFYYADRQWKSIFTGGPQLLACTNNDFYWPLALAVTKNATINRFTTATIELLCTSGGVPTDEGCTQPLSSGPKTHLNSTMFCFVSLYPACEESPQLGASRPYNLMFTKKHGSKDGMSNAHKTQNQSTITHTSHNSSSQHNPKSSLLKWSSSCYHKESNARKWSLGA